MSPPVICGWSGTWQRGLHPVIANRVPITGHITRNLPVSAQYTGFFRRESMTSHYLSRAEYIPVLLLLAGVVVLVMTGEAILTAGLPAIEHEFPVTGVFEYWILPVVMLIGAAASPLVGIAGDTYGHKRLLTVCLVLYLAGLAGGLLASDIWTLLLSRALQGGGIAAIPLTYAVIREQFPLQAADTAIGVISAMYGGGTFIGVIVGSLITEYFSWRATYFLLIPVTMLILLLVHVVVRETTRYRKECPPDVTGFVLLVGSLLSGLSALTLLEPDSDSGWSVLIFLAVAILFFLLFVRVERRAACPIADFSLMTQRPVVILFLIGFLTILAFFMLLQMMPYLIQMPTGLSLSEGYIALIMIPGTFCDMIAGPVTGRMMIRTGVRLPCMIGGLLLAFPVALLLIFPPSVLLLVLVWMIFSAGMSTAATAQLIGAMQIVAGGRTAETTGLMQSVQTFGGMIGPVITGLFLTGSGVAMLHDGETWMVPSAGGYFLVSLGIFILGLLVFGLSWLFLGNRGGVIR